ncbi:MAG: STAS domain-containing protein [Acetobacteraceae bacterium]
MPIGKSRKKCCAACKDEIEPGRGRRPRSTIRQWRRIMQLATRKVYDVVVVDLTGSLDSHSAGEIGDQLTAIAQGADKHVLLNLEKVEYVSSAGLRIILRAAKLLQNAHGEMKLCAAQETVKDVMLTAGFDSLLKLYDSEKDAFAAFSG